MTTHKKTIEVELRGLMTAEQVAALVARLTAEGVASEADDKDTYFFNMTRGIFKVCDDLSKNQAKLSMKIGSEANGALEELEVPLEPAKVQSLIRFLSTLGLGDPHLVPQQRTNWFLDGATLSLKFTKDFQHHFEMEGRLLEDEAEVEAERQRLHGVCADYGLTPLTPQEIAARVAEIRKRIGFAK